MGESREKVQANHARVVRTSEVFFLSFLLYAPAFSLEGVSTVLEGTHNLDKIKRMLSMRLQDPLGCRDVM